jgi:glycosyltransferase involved in cell wall biosynthesis
MNDGLVLAPPLPAPLPAPPVPPVDTGARRRIVLHDYGGYSFPIQLARWLAGQGHEVLYLYSADVEAPRGRLAQSAGDPAGLRLEAVSTGRPLPKYALLRRWWQEMDYGARLGARTTAFHPDVVLSTNTPPAVQAALLKALRKRNLPLLCWVQDIFSIGAAEILKGKPAPLRWAACRFLERVEFGTMRDSAGLVVISDDFLPVLARYGVRHPRSAVVENWAPQGEIRPLPKDNAWSRAHGLADRFVFLCAGTMGMKHNPELLAALARSFRNDPEVRVVVVSQGIGRRWLEGVKQAEALDNLLLLDFQPFESLSQVLASADVAVVVLESFAGALSVPSKVYSHFCSNRPILGALPASNHAHRLIRSRQAGLCVEPTDETGFIATAMRLRQDAALRKSLADGQAAYAADAFDIDRIGSRFSALIEECCQRAAV